MNFKYELIFNDIHKAINDGLFLPMSKLPSLRKTSIKYDCSLSVVIQAYNKLEAIGFIVSKEKSGYIVCDNSNIPLPTPEEEVHTLLPNISKANVMTSQIVDMAMDKNILPFGAAIPDESILAISKLNKYISQKVKNTPELLTSYTPASGSVNLRKEIVKYMFHKGVLINYEDIIITNGCSEALYHSIKILTSPGDTVAIETPTYFSLISILEQLELKVIEIPTRADSGLDLKYLRKTLDSNKIKTLIFSPTFQNPLCSIMNESALKELYKISLDYDFTLIEDDIYADCSFDKTVHKPLKALDNLNRVIYCSSFSKTLSSGIRVGWVIPGIMLNRFCEAKQVSSLGGPALLQEALADYFRDGCYDLHLKSFRKRIYSQTYGIKKLIEQYFPPDIKITKPKGGYFLWIEFHPGFNSFKLFEMAYDLKIGIVPGPVFSSSGNFVNCIRISCASIITDRSIEGIKILGRLAKKLSLNTQ